MRTALLLAVLFFVPLPTVHAGAAEQKPAAPPLRIGAIYGLSGFLAELGEDAKDGVVLASEELKRKGVISLEPLFEDHRWEPRTSVSAFQKLRAAEKTDIVFVIGSTLALPLKPLAEKEKVLLFASASHQDLTKDGSMVVRHWNSGDHEAASMLAFLKERAPKTVGLLSIEAEGGRTFEDAFEQGFASAMPGSVLVKETHPMQERDLRPQLLRLLNAKIDALVVNSFGMGCSLAIEQARQLGMPAEIYMSFGFVLSGNAVQEVQKKELGGFFYQDYAPPPENFQKLFQNRFGRPPRAASLYTFSDCELLADAYLNTDHRPESMARYIKSKDVFAATFERLKINENGDIPVQTVIKRWQ